MPNKETPGTIESLPPEVLDQFTENGFVPRDGNDADLACARLLDEALMQAGVDCANPDLVKTRLDTAIAKRLRSPAPARADPCEEQWGWVRTDHLYLEPDSPVPYHHTPEAILRYTTENRRERHRHLESMDNFWVKSLPLPGPTGNPVCHSQRQPPRPGVPGHGIARRSRVRHAPSPATVGHQSHLPSASAIPARARTSG